MKCRPPLSLVCMRVGDSPPSVFAAYSIPIFPHTPGSTRLWTTKMDKMMKLVIVDIINNHPSSLQACWFRVQSVGSIFVSMYVHKEASKCTLLLPTIFRRISSGVVVFAFTDHRYVVLSVRVYELACHTAPPYSAKHCSVPVCDIAMYQCSACSKHNIV